MVRVPFSGRRAAIRRKGKNRKEANKTQENADEKPPQAQTVDPIPIFTSFVQAFLQALFKHL